MKDNLFEMLMRFFEKTLTQIKEADPASLSITKSSIDHANSDADAIFNDNNQVFRQRKKESIRVFTPEERFKFTKASYQFIVRLMHLELIAIEVIETIIHQLLFSDSRFITLHETKWAIRNTLAEQLNSKQLAFLDLVLYHQEDRLPLH